MKQNIIKEITISSELIDSKEKYEIDKDNNVISVNKVYLDVGNYEIIFKYKKKEFKRSIEVKDTIPPVFTEFKETIVAEQNAENFDITKFFESSDLSLCFITTLVEVDISEVGEFQLEIIAKDEHDNETKKVVTLKVVDITEAKKDGVITKALDGTIFKSKQLKEEQESLKNKSTASSNNSSSKSSSSNNSNSNTTNNNTNNNSNTTPIYKSLIASQYFEQINQYRVNNGLKALPHTNKAQTEADKRAMELVSNYGHNSSDDFAENIGKGTANMYNFVDEWKKSPPHNATLLREIHKSMAISVVEYKGMWYVVASFELNYDIYNE